MSKGFTSFLKKKKSVIVSFALAATLCFGTITIDSMGYNCKISNVSYGFAKSQETFVNAVDETEEVLRKKYGVDELYINAEIAKTPTVQYDNSKFMDYEELSRIMINNYEDLSLGVHASDMYINDTKVGTVENELSGEEALDGVIQQVAKLSGRQEILTFEIKDTVSYEKRDIDFEDLQNPKEITNIITPVKDAKEETKDNSETTVEDSKTKNEQTAPSDKEENKNVDDSKKDENINIDLPEINITVKKSDVIEKEIAYSVIERNNADKYIGTREVVQNGQIGTLEETWEVTMVNGEETDRVLTEEKTLVEPIDTIIEIGTKPIPIQTEDGKIEKPGTNDGDIVAVTPGQTSGDKETTIPETPSNLDYIWPISAEYYPKEWDDMFGERIHPIDGTVSHHSGCDIACPSGTPIVAPKAGTVTLAGENGGYGNCVIIDHGDGYTTLYGHQSEIAVSYGESVVQGQIIGYVGSTGKSNGPHLHYTVMYNGEQIDPLLLYSSDVIPVGRADGNSTVPTESVPSDTTVAREEDTTILEENETITEVVDQSKTTTEESTVENSVTE